MQVFKYINNCKGKAAILSLCFCLALTFAHAQTRGKLEVVKDPRVDTLIARRVSLNKYGSIAATAGSSSYGYRVQFFSGSSRKAAFEAQNEVQQLYPGIRTYINYRDPNFKVKAGDFRTRIEASKMVSELKGKFTTMFIISEKINLPKIDTNSNPQ